MIWDNQSLFVFFNIPGLLHGLTSEGCNIFSNPNQYLYPNITAGISNQLYEIDYTYFDFRKDLRSVYLSPRKMLYQITFMTDRLSWQSTPSL